MSFAGDLEHLPIVDIIQLLHSTRKTGTLCLKSHKGESQLVFSDGYFVSANHVNNNVRIGQVLVGMKIITSDQLDQALLEQKNAGHNRKPLVATLIDQGIINKEDAYKGLEELIEMTIVEVLTWTSGTFSLDVTNSDISDEYRYFPETLQQEILMNAQSILMDALRIYDEKMRDGTLSEVFFSSVEGSFDDVSNSEPSDLSITADLLGLDAIDTLKKNIPSVFSGLKDHDPSEEHRRVIGEELQDIPVVDQDRICSVLTAFSRQLALGKTGSGTNSTGLAIILFSRDNFITHALKTVCKLEDFFIFTTDEEMNLDLIIEQSLSRDLMPLLVIDSPAKKDENSLSTFSTELVQHKLTQFPLIPILQAIPLSDYKLSLQALQTGVKAILPRPSKENRKETFVDDTITFLTTFQSYLKTYLSAPDHQQAIRRFKECSIELNTLTQPPEVASALLGFASTMFERTITFVVGKMELIAEKGIGVKADKSSGPTPPMMFKIPLEEPSIFKEILEKGNLYYGTSNDTILKNCLFKEIGIPRSSKTLLLPIKSFGRVIAIIYGDFGPKAGSPVQIDLLDILARHASLVLDNAFYRKRFEKPTQSQ